MNHLKQFGLRAISGEDQSLAGGAARAFATAVEPFYAAAMRFRNSCYDRGFFSTHDLGRPTISVGNITTGGTGKTPVVKWLAEQLRQRGRHPAILLRGYGSSETRVSDEAQLLDQALNAPSRSLRYSEEPDRSQQNPALRNTSETGAGGFLNIKIPVQANPSRIIGAAQVLALHPGTDVFILDDGFQHRRAKRDFNLVLISATQPFGFDHVLPRGLLREPLSGLKRADAFLLTRCDLVAAEVLKRIETTLASFSPNASIYRCNHVQRGLWIPGENRQISMQSLAGQNVFLTAGIGDPDAFTIQIESAGATVVGTKWFEDHHAFSAMELDHLIASAKQSGADRLITTEKDWVKMKDRSAATDLIVVVQLEIEFHESHDLALLGAIDERLISIKR